MILYSDTEPSSGPIKYNPVKAYARHYDNLLYLQFLSRKSPDPQERGQALREMTIAERKLRYHERSISKEEMLDVIKTVKRKWNA